jgi:hypothetical protein
VEKTNSRRVNRFVFIAAAVCLLSGTFAFAAKKTKKKGPPRRISADKAFSYILPKGYRLSRSDRRAAAAWMDPWGGAITVSRISKSQARKWYSNKALKAAKKSRAAMKPDDRKGEIFSKVLKKTHKNGLVYYFFTRNKKKPRGSKPKVTGFINMGDLMYRIEGPIAAKKGLNAVYWVLSSFKPLNRAQRKRSFKASDKPSMIQDQEEKDQCVPLY